MTEQLQPSIPENAVDKKPFVIRGHHLTNFILISVIPYIDAAKKKREAYESGAEKWQYQLDISKERINEYIEDVAGKSKEDMDEFEGRTRAMFDRFVLLPDDHPVEITENIPDEICANCIVGQHCTARNFAGSSINDKDGDIDFINVFLKLANHLDLPEPKLMEKTAFFSDSEPEKARVFQTTLGVVKKVLIHIYDGD